MKVFSAKFGGVAPFGTTKASNLQKFPLRKPHFSLIPKSFLPRKFPTIRYVSCTHLVYCCMVRFHCCYCICKHMTKETYCTESLHAHINRARLTVYEMDVFSRAPHPHTQPLLWEPLQFITHGRTCCIYLWRLLYVM